MKDFWDWKFIKARSGKAQVKVNEAFNSGCVEVKSRMRSATAKHKGYEEFDTGAFEPFCLPENGYDTQENSYDYEYGASTTSSESSNNKDEFQNYPTIKTEKSFIRLQKSLSMLNPKNAITTITSTLKKKL